MMERIKEYFWYVVAIGILLLLVNTCTDSIVDKYIGEGNVYEKQLERKVELLNKAKVKAERVSDSLHADNQKKDKEIKNLKLKNSDIDNKIAEIKKDGVLVAKKVRKFTYKEDAEFFSENYGMPKSVSYTDKGVTLSDSLPNKVIEDVVDKFYLDKELNLTKDKLSNKDKEINLLEQKVENKDEEIKTISDLSSKKDDVIDASAELNKSLKKQNKNLKTKSIIQKVAIGVAFTLGFLIAK